MITVDEFYRGVYIVTAYAPVGMCDVDGNTSYSVLSSPVNLKEAYFAVNVWLQVCACYYDEWD